jgi:hypothetical protein
VDVLRQVWDVGRRQEHRVDGQLIGCVRDEVALEPQSLARVVARVEDRAGQHLRPDRV